MAKASANTVSHKDFFPVLAQASGNDRGAAFKADATPETAAAIVKALAVSLAKLGGFKSADVIAAMGGSAPAKRAAKPAAEPEAPTRKRRVAAAVKETAKPARRAKAPAFAKDDKVKALEDGRMMNAVVVGLRGEGAKYRVTFVKSGKTANVLAKDVTAR